MTSVAELDERMREFEINLGRLNEAKEQLGERVNTAQTVTLRLSLGLITGLVFILGLVFGLIRIDDSANLERFKEEIREQALASSARPPVLELLHENGAPLDGSQVTVKVERDKDGTKHLILDMTLRNTGGSRSGGLFAKIYTGSEVQHGVRSTDERGYNWESLSRRRDHSVSEVPAGAWIRWKFHIRLPENISPKMGATTTAKVKFYYGIKKVSEAEFAMKVLF